jgi:hypothetical protein
MAASDPNLAVATVRAVTTRRRAAAWCAASAALLVCAALALGYADAALALGDRARQAVGWLWLAAAPAALAALALRWRALAPQGDAAVRAAEDALGDRERTLAQALELARRDDELARAAATALAARLPLAELPARLPRSRAPRWLLLLLAAGALGGATWLAAPYLARTVWARWTDPLGDHPPWSPTRLVWAEIPGSVRARHDLRVEVAAEGRPCATPVLAISGPDGVARLAMFPIGPNRWAAEVARVEDRLTLWAEGGGTRTKRRMVVIDPVPELTALDLALIQPAYAALPEATRRLRPGEQVQLDALPGASLRLEPISNRPLAAVHLARDAGAWQRLPLSAGRVALAAEPGLWRLRLEATDGAIGEAGEPLRLGAREDLPPQADFLQPSRDAYATPDAIVPWQAIGSDDLGLVRAERAREVNGLPVPTTPDAASGRSWTWAGKLDLIGLGADPGDVIALAALVRDSNPASGRDGRPGKVSGIAQRRIQVVDWQSYNQLLLQRLDVSALQGKYDGLAEELAQMAAEMKRIQAELQGDELAKALAALGKRANALAARVEGMKRPNPLFRVEPDLQRALQQAAEDLAAGRRPRWDPEALRRDLAELTRRAQAMDLARRFGQLADAEQNTVERLEPLAGHRRPTDGDLLRLAELGQAEELLAEEVQAWLALLRKWVERETEALPREAAELDQLGDAVDEAGIIDLKRRAGAAAKAGDGREARRLAAEARDRMLELLAQAGRSAAGAGAGAQLGMGWSNGFGDDLGGLMGAAGMWGMGGRGSAGLGMWLGYGGDDLGGSLPGAVADIFGPENLGATGAERNTSAGDPVAAMAASGAAPAGLGRAVRRAAAVRGQAAARSTLGDGERRLVDDYFRRLEGTP